MAPWFREDVADQLEDPLALRLDVARGEDAALAVYGHLPGDDEQRPDADQSNANNVGEPPMGGGGTVAGLRVVDTGGAGHRAGLAMQPTTRSHPCRRSEELAISAGEQVLSTSVESLGTGDGESEGVGDSGECIEREGDSQRVLDLFG